MSKKSRAGTTELGARSRKARAKPKTAARRGGKVPADQATLTPDRKPAGPKTAARQDGKKVRAKPKTAARQDGKKIRAKPKTAARRGGKVPADRTIPAPDRKPARPKVAAGRKAAAAKQSREKKTVVKQKALLQSLATLGSDIYNDLDRGRFPKFSVPSRSVKNIVYDQRLRQYILGGNSSVRSSRNTSQLRSFTQLMWLAFFANRLSQAKKSSTLRDVYYSSQAFAIDFKNQSESDSIIVDLEAVITKPREDFHVFPEERSAIFGDLDIEYTVPGYEGKRMNLSNHPDGYAIGPSLTTAELVDSSAEVIIAIEKGGLFTRFVEEQVDKKFKAIIVDTGGQAPRSTRTLLRRLHDELSLPVVILTDGDVYGEHIAMVIKSGSANAAHLRELTVPDAKWVGVWASDIDKYKLPTIPMTVTDIKRCHDLLKDPRYQEGLWKKELDIFLKIKKKAELEAFSKYGLTNITDKYLPAKLEMAKSL